LVRRRGEGVPLPSGFLALRELNEIMYGVPGVADFAARLEDGALCLTVCGDAAGEAVLARLRNLPAVARGLADKTLRVDIQYNHRAAPAVAGLDKRRILIGS
jgi:hypothetical protein